VGTHSKNWLACAKLLETTLVSMEEALAIVVERDDFFTSNMLRTDVHEGHRLPGRLALSSQWFPLRDR
jgi:hypothetical protein